MLKNWAHATQACYLHYLPPTNFLALADGIHKNRYNYLIQKGWSEVCLTTLEWPGLGSGRAAGWASQSDPTGPPPFIERGDGQKLGGKNIDSEAISRCLPEGGGGSEGQWWLGGYWLAGNPRMGITFFWSKTTTVILQRKDAEHVDIPKPTERKRRRTAAKMGRGSRRRARGGGPTNPAAGPRRRGGWEWWEWATHPICYIVTEWRVAFLKKTPGRL